MSPAVSQDRDALYYPYVSFSDPNWLKATLLSFPRVYRILPSNVDPGDTPEVKKFSEARLDSKDDLPLLAPADPLEDPGVLEAQKRLIERLRADDEFPKRFSKKRALGKSASLAPRYRIYRGKMRSELLQFLVSKGVAWDEHGRANENAPWFNLHPKLSEAIMSTIALSIAKRWDRDIVTDEFRIHHALETLDEDDLYRDLTRRASPRTPTAPAKQDLAEELVFLTLSTRFDMSRLSAEQVIELKKQG